LLEQTLAKKVYLSILFLTAKQQLHHRGRSSLKFVDLIAPDAHGSIKGAGLVAVQISRDWPRWV
jgi:hypothetical protein